MWGIIATWKMAYDGIVQAKELLENGEKSGAALEFAIKAVEDNPEYSSVGFGGLPNEDGVLEMDAAYMDGNSLQIGAVAAVTDIANPISVAKKLSQERFNNLRVGAGATHYARIEGFEQKKMLTEKAESAWKERLKAMHDGKLTAYDGHDTVGMVALDTKGAMTAGTSTSGLFMKKPGRVGDSPLVGSGFYADSEVGGATATGVGEDIMKGVLSYEIVRLISEGLTPQEACDIALYSFEKKLTARSGKPGAFSVIALDKSGKWGAATNVEFPFCVATAEEEPAVYVAYPVGNGKTRIEAFQS